MDTGEAGYLAGWHKAARAGSTFPAATQVIPDLDLAGAYKIQHRLVASRLRGGETIAGFKSGLMSVKSLADRKASKPLVGVLFSSAAAQNGATIDTCGYRRPALEMKIGFVFAKGVRERVPSAAALKAYIGQIRPVVELPDIAYADDKHYVALDMVAANISSARFVEGAAIAVPPVDLDSLAVSVTRDAAPFTRGLGGESLEGQWPSLLTVVNLIIDNGYRIAPGQMVLTGKIGDKRDLTPGFYAADYGPLGSFAFTMTGCGINN